MYTLHVLFFTHFLNEFCVIENRFHTFLCSRPWIVCISTQIRSLNIRISMLMDKETKEIRLYKLYMYVCMFYIYVMYIRS